MMMRRDEGSVTASTDRVYFDASTGLPLHRGGRVGPVMSVERFLAGLHEIQFRHWPVRWLYFGMGLTGCVLMATGYMFWVQSRQRRHVALGLAGARLVNGLAAGSVTGMLLATLAFFVANRALPSGAQFLGQERAALEVWSFYLTWLAGFSHGWWRSGSAWREQCRVIAGLALAAAVLNAVTTKDHLLHNLTQPHLWGVAGMDTMLLGGSVIAALAATALRPEKTA